LKNVSDCRYGSLLSAICQQDSKIGLEPRIIPAIYVKPFNKGRELIATMLKSRSASPAPNAKRYREDAGAISAALGRAFLSVAADGDDNDPRILD
jgi:hypothetical protein